MYRYTVFWTINENTKQNKRHYTTPIGIVSYILCFKIVYYSFMTNNNLLFNFDPFTRDVIPLPRQKYGNFLQGATEHNGVSVPDVPGTSGGAGETSSLLLGHGTVLADTISNHFTRLNNGDTQTSNTGDQPARQIGNEETSTGNELLKSLGGVVGSAATSGLSTGAGVAIGAGLQLLEGVVSSVGNFAAKSQSNSIQKEQYDKQWDAASRAGVYAPQQLGTTQSRYGSTVGGNSFLQSPNF